LTAQHPPPRTSRILRWLGLGLTGFAVLACLTLLAVRYFALPQLDVRRAEIASYLSRQLGHPVDIESISTGWDGWNPEVTVRGLSVRDRMGASTLPLLELPAVTGVIAWTSLPLARLQFKELSIDRPRLAIRRDTAGRIHVAGIEIDPDAQADDSGFADWLLRQRRIVVRDALITWNDDRRNAPQLVLDRVQFRMENAFGRHRIGLTGTPPPEIADPIDVRADLAGDSLRDWQHAKGDLYVRLDYADLAAWSEWLPLPVPMQSGKGALRTWFGIADGVVESVVGDLELEDVRTRLRADLPELDLVHVAGHVGWKQDATTRELSARALTVTPRNAPPMAPLDFALAYRVDGQGRSVDGAARVDRLELEPLAAIAANLPLPAAMRQQLAHQAPRGTLTEATYDWKGPADAPETFRAHASLQNLGVRPEGDRPGVLGLSGVLEATQKGGSVRVDSRNLTLAIPAVFAQPITLDTLVADAVWERTGDAIAVRGTVGEAANADLAGGATFAWQSAAKGPGSIDLDAKVQRADARHIDRYIPLHLSATVRTWLARAIPQGSGSDGRIVLKGDLAEFPFPTGRNGQFLVTAKVKGATLDYARDWPPIADIDAELRFEGARMLVQASRGRSLGATIGRTTAEIPDLRSPRLRVDGEASGATSDFLAFVARSPVAGWIDRATDGFAATGNGKLALRFDLSLTDSAHSVAGEYQLLGNQLRMPGAPELAQLTGTLRFTNREMRAGDLAFETLGGPARASFVAGGDKLVVNASGTAHIAQVRNAFPSRWLDRASGTAEWKLAVDGRSERAGWILESSLKGTAIDLPAPIGKVADAALPFRAESRPLPGGTGRDQLRVDYGSVARVIADRRVRDGEAVAERVLVLLGRSMARGGEPERAGIAVRGDVDAVNVDDWIALARIWDVPAGGSADGGGALELTSLDLSAREMDLAGRGFHGTTLAARRSGGDWRLTLASKELEGTATWEPRSTKFANGRVVARLARVALPGPGQMEGWHGAPRTPTPRGEDSANTWPEIDLVAERYIGRRGDLGRLELLAKPQGTDWRIERLALVNDAGTLTADGWWHSRGRDQQTRFDVALDVKDAAAYLAHFGLPDAVKGAPTKIEGQLSWNGSPDEFDYLTLGGAFKVHVGPGQFTKIEPGIGKLLGVLSLQALPRRITLDFRDVFSDGFAFDTIAGNVRIGNGIMHTENLQLNGPAAKVMITGDVDLKNETQKLSVVVQPSLATSVSAGAGAAAVLLLAHPVVAAAVGAGTLLAQKVMKDPIEQIFSYEYAVRGSWEEPLVDRVQRNRLGTSADAGAAGTAPR
jgi:uncharacterized protein (TIGR02099 family)